MPNALCPLPLTEILMPYDKSIHLLQGGAVMVECGPMRLVIDARVGQVVQPLESVRAAEQAVRFLEGVAQARPFLGRSYRELISQVADPLALKMAASVQAVGDDDLTPMAAVAGTIADAVADYLFQRGMTRVLVDNGGDVAIRSCDGEPVTVGIRPRVDNQGISHTVVLGSERTAWGVATSGLGGRSLTRGVLDAATIVAADASLADAAATAVANAGCITDDAVVRKPAEALDPHTDITGLDVTFRVGRLAGESKQKAVDLSMHRAEQLIANRVIFGAFLTCQGLSAMTPFIAQRLKAV
jgi:ApbE superfamily uncharacterized protein (UPF0280 family)